MRRYILLSFIMFVCKLISLSADQPDVHAKEPLKPDSVDCSSFQFNFDLAQIFKESKRYDDAIKHYEETRVEDGELGWYAEYMIGKCYQLKDDWTNALRYYQSAFERRPTRSEPLFDIAHYYVSISKYAESYYYLNIGEKIRYPKNDKLFIDSSIYKYKFKELFGYALHRIERYRSEALKYIDQIAFDSELPADVKRISLLNSLHCVANIRNAKFIPLQPIAPLLCDWSSERYKPCNPSIMKTDDGYIVNCRSVNYVQWCPGHLVVDGSGKPKTKNVFIKFDKNLNQVFETCVTEDPSLVVHNTHTQGLEDLRIFNLNDEIYFTGTTCQLNPKSLPKICLGKFDINQSDNSVNVNKITLLQGPKDERAEKNWMPFVVDGELLAIYSLSPYIVYKPCIETGVCHEFINKDLGFDFSKLSGSAPPIPFEDGYLLMVHEGIWNVRRYYFHRFFYLDKNFELKKYSDPFSFKHKGIEMCCGMTIDHDETNLIMTIGLEDREAYLCSVELKDIRSMLKDISELKC